MMPVTAILYDESDAVDYLKKKPVVDIIRSLTPNASAQLVNLSGAVPQSTLVLSDCQQAKVIARVKKIEEKLLSSLNDQSQLNVAVKCTLQSIVHVLAGIASITWEIAKNPETCLIRRNGNWTTITSRSELQQYLVTRFDSNIVKLFRITERPAFSKLLQWISLKQLKKEKFNKLLLFTDFSYGSEHIWNTIKEQTDDYHSAVLVKTKSGFAGFIKSLVHLYKNVNSNNRPFGLLAIPSKNNSYNLADGIISTIDDPVVKPILQKYLKDLNQTCCFLASLHENMLECLKVLKPSAIISNQVRWHRSAVLAEIAEILNIENHLLSHGSHTIPDSRIAEVEQIENANGLLFTPFSTINYFQSPQSALFAENNNTNGCHCKPVMWGYKSIGKSRPAEEERIILHAGTYKTLSLPRPWVYETSNEFVEGLKSLIYATASLENVKLVIRIRTGPECSIKSLQKLLPKLDHYHLKTDGTFLDDLSHAQLLVSFSSTTIEEALNAKKPVLLWGGTRRYFHLPAKKSIPTKNDRAAVYAPESENDLGKMIDAILDSHSDSPLTENELSDYVWPASVPGIELLFSNLGIN
jgi:hypothetical protein